MKNYARIVALLMSMVWVSNTGCIKTMEEEEVEPDPSDCTTMTPPIITVSATSVESGTALNFSLARVDPGSSYLWTGPNGFTSTQANLEIPQTLSSHAGIYTVEEVNAWGCRRSSSSPAISVMIPSPACMPASNTANIQGVATMNFSTAYGRPIGGGYFINASSSGGDIELEFPGTPKPSAGVYRVRPLSDDLKTGDVRVRLNAASSYWPASSVTAYRGSAELIDYSSMLGASVLIYLELFIHRYGKSYRVKSCFIHSRSLRHWDAGSAR